MGAAARRVTVMTFTSLETADVHSGVALIL